MEEKKYVLGTIEASEQLIYDLYIDLKRKVNKWASITHQTAQARMGYVGQHLVSVVTGFPGGRSGARGKDLVLPNGEYAEIKTCYRIDQLGKCNTCGVVVSGIESSCPECGSEDIERKEDSKWLISIRHDNEFAEILNPKYYYLVLFEFTDIEQSDTIRASIWRVDSTAPGFAYCMIDYYKNIRANSSSKAPFDFWPYQLKFDIMRPMLIYRSHIAREDIINTNIFPNRDAEQLHAIKPLQNYSRSSNLTSDKILKFSEIINTRIEPRSKKKELLEQIQQFLDESKPNPKIVADSLARALYMPEIQTHIRDLPQSIKDKIGL
jgi:predicted RNA-binding Zn-ribbon protein involved in translation (DUF1610 family)